MNQETVEILESIPKNVYLRAKMLDVENQEISIGIASILEDGSGIYSPDLKTQQDSLKQRAKCVQMTRNPPLKLVQIRWHGGHDSHYHFQV